MIPAAFQLPRRLDVSELLGCSVPPLNQLSDLAFAGFAAPVQHKAFPNFRGWWRVPHRSVGGAPRLNHQVGPKLFEDLIDDLLSMFDCGKRVRAWQSRKCYPTTAVKAHFRSIVERSRDVLVLGWYGSEYERAQTLERG